MAVPALERDPVAAGPIIRGFAGTGFRVGEQVFATGLLLTPDTALGWDAPPVEALTVATLAPLLASNPEFILLGTGTTLVRPPPALAAALDAQGVALEPMDSRAAARAWGLLRGEGRRIAAALLPIR